MENSWMSIRPSLFISARALKVHRDRMYLCIYTIPLMWIDVNECATSCQDLMSVTSCLTRFGRGWAAAVLIEVRSSWPDRLTRQTGTGSEITGRSHTNNGCRWLCRKRHYWTSVCLSPPEMTSEVLLQDLWRHNEVDTFCDSQWRNSRRYFMF